MIEGVLRHCTDMKIQSQYFDSHGQSAIGFAFTHLRGFELAPRLRTIPRQNLMLASAGQRAGLSNLAPNLSGRCDALDLQGAGRAWARHQVNLYLPLFQVRKPALRDPRSSERDRELEQRQRLRFLREIDEIATNRVRDWEIAALPLQLVQTSIFNVNTCMVQSILAYPTLAVRLSSEDMRGLSPLLYLYINPYGRFELDLDERIFFERRAA